MATTAARTDVPPTAVPARQVPVEEPLSAAQQQQKRKRAAGGQEKPNNDFVPVPLAVPTAAVAGKTKQLPGKRVGKGAAAGVRDPVTVAQQSNLRYDGGVNAIPSYPQPILSYLPPGYTLPGIGGSGAISQGPAPNSHMTNEERLFFDRVADFIDDKFTYYEFLKLLNLLVLMDAL
jgi:histone deacetylase complex regulatory component SIN3